MSKSRHVNLVRKLTAQRQKTMASKAVCTLETELDETKEQTSNKNYLAA